MINYILANIAVFALRECVYQRFFCSEQQFSFKDGLFSGFDAKKGSTINPPGPLNWTPMAYLYAMIPSKITVCSEYLHRSIF